MSRNKWLDDPIVEPDHTWLLHMSDGSTLRDSDVTVTEADYRRMWAGYVCPWCYQILETAFERTCKDWCIGGPDVTEADWRAYMTQRFGGEKWIGPSRETMDRMNSPIWTPPASRN
jgi:hypothetical protein